MMDKMAFLFPKIIPRHRSSAVTNPTLHVRVEDRSRKTGKEGRRKGGARRATDPFARWMCSGFLAEKQNAWERPRHYTCYSCKCCTMVLFTCPLRAVYVISASCDPLLLLQIQNVRKVGFSCPSTAGNKREIFP